MEEVHVRCVIISEFSFQYKLQPLPSLSSDTRAVTQKYPKSHISSLGMLIYPIFQFSARFGANFNINLENLTIS